MKVEEVGSFFIYLFDLRGSFLFLGRRKVGILLYT